MVQILKVFLPVLFAIDSSIFSYASNVVYFEIGGQGIGFSLNYENRFREDFSLRIGGSYLIVGIGGSLGISYLTHPKSYHHIEFGVGVTYVHASSIYDGDTATEDLLPSLSVGYRYQSPEGGFFFKAMFTTFFDLTKGNSGRFEIGENLSVVFIPLGGMALGWSF